MVCNKNSIKSNCKIGTGNLVGNIKYFKSEKKGTSFYRLTGRSRKVAGKILKEVEVFSPNPENMLGARFYIAPNKNNEIYPIVMDMLYSGSLPALLEKDTTELVTVSKVLKGFYDKDGPYVMDLELKHKKISEADLKQRARYAQIATDIVGDLNITEMKERETQMYFIEELTKKGSSKAGYSKKTITNILSVLSICFNHAIEEGVIDFNPIENIRKRLPDGKPVSIYGAFETDEIFALLTNSYAWGGSYIEYAATMFALATGLRIGEILALTDADINLKTLQIKITKSKMRGYRGGGVKDTKTSSDRVVPISKLAFCAISLLLNKKGYIFSVSGSNPVSYENVRKKFKKALTASRITRPIGKEKIVFHSLRHTWFTLMCVNSVPEGLISLVGGHDTQTINASMMNARYTNGTKEGYKVITNVIDNLFTEEQFKCIESIRTEIFKNFTEGCYNN